MIPNPIESNGTRCQSTSNVVAFDSKENQEHLFSIRLGIENRCSRRGLESRILFLLDFDSIRSRIFKISLGGSRLLSFRSRLLSILSRFALDCSPFALDCSRVGGGQQAEYSSRSSILPFFGGGGTEYSSRSSIFFLWGPEALLKRKI